MNSLMDLDILCHFLALWPWVSYLTSLRSVSTPVNCDDYRTYFTGSSWRLHPRMYGNYLTQCLAYKRLSINHSYHQCSSYNSSTYSKNFQTQVLFTRESFYTHFLSCAWVELMGMFRCFTNRDSKCWTVCVCGGGVTGEGILACSCIYKHSNSTLWRDKLINRWGITWLRCETTFFLCSVTF